MTVFAHAGHARDVKRDDPPPEEIDYTP